VNKLPFALRFFVLTAALLNIQVFTNVMCSIPDILMNHSALKVFELPTQQCSVTSLTSQKTWILNTRSVRLKKKKYKGRPYELCKELFFKYVPCAFLSSFKLQQNSCCLDRSTTYHTTQLLPAISKHVTIAQQTTQFPIRCAWSQRRMDGRQQIVVPETSVLSTT
jgi:hypothetical protein